MNDVTTIDPDTGEVMSTGLASFDPGNAPLAVQLAKVELDQAISTAKAYPRNLSRVRDNIDALVMLDEETAKECVYALPRGGKPIKGPSVRFAEIVVSQFGNCKVGSRVVDVNRFEKYVEAEGVFIDLEAGMTRTARIRRRITDRSGRLFNDDMIVVTGNAACAIALREAVLKGVPKALWRRAYDAAESVIAGDVKTLTERRENAVKAFAAWGVTPDQIFAALEVGGLDDIGLPEIGTLTAMFKAIKSGEQAVEDYFPAKVDAKAAVDAAKGTAGKLADIAGKAEEKKAEPQKSAERESSSNGDVATGGGALASGSEPEASQDGDKAPAGGDTPAEGENATGEPENRASDEPKTESDEDPEAAAYRRGRKAFSRGQKADACPPDLRKTEALAEAWLAGWKDARDEAGED
jgi:ribosome modulation factor